MWLTHFRWFVLALTVMVGQRGQAADAPDPALQAAKRAFEEGQGLFVRGQHDEAATRFLFAFDHKPFPAFLYNAAVALEKGGDLARALATFERYLVLAPAAKDAAEVRERVSRLRELLSPGATSAGGASRLPVLGTKGLVVIESKPPGANLYLDDKSSGPFAQTPWQGSLEPRPTRIIVEAKGFKTEERTLHPQTDKIHEVYVALSEEHFLGWIEVVSNVAGAEVFLDRPDVGALGRTPYTGHVRPGRHTVWLVKPGYEDVRQEIDVLPGTATTHMLPMTLVPHGWINVGGKPAAGARVKVDGQPACTAPCRQKVAPGKHRVLVERDGMEPYRGDIDVGRSSETSLDVRFSPRPSRSSAWTAAVLTAAFVGGGTYLGLQSRSLRNELRTASDPKRPLDASAALVDTNDGRVERGRIMAIGANVLLGLGAVTGLISVVNFLSSGPDSVAEIEQRTLGLAPVMVPSGVGVGARGRF